MRLMPVVGQFELDAIWLDVEHYLDAACMEGTGELSADGLLELCKTRQALLSVVIDPIHREPRCAVVTQMVELPDGDRRCDILACGGVGMREWIGLLKEIEQGATANGASSIRFLGRVGWARVLPDYSVPQVVYQKDLRH